MAIKLNEEKLNEFGATQFGPGSHRGGFSGAWFQPTGRLAQWYSRFFATKAQPFVATQGQPGPTELHPLAGDSIVHRDPITAGVPGGISYARTVSPVLNQQEIERKRRYTQYENMDEYPEVGAAFDIYADDSTQLDTRNRRWVIQHDNDLVVQEVEDLFENIKLDRYYWDICRNTCKYGDNFVELVIDENNPKAGIQRIKILNPNHIIRVENDYGYLTDFLQEIPDKDDWSAMGSQGSEYSQNKYITLDKNQIVHFRLFTSDPIYYPYGKSIAALAVRVFRALRLMEDAMLIYRLEKAPERRVFYIDTGNLPKSKQEVFIEKQKQKFKKEKFYDKNGRIDERYNPLSTSEDFWVPISGQNSQTKIETLQGAQNLGDVDDVKYFRDKLMAALKIPKDYVVEKDQSPERKANLSQLDVKFARLILRVQQQFEIGLETIAKRHLTIKGFPASMVGKLKIKLPSPSDMFEKRKLDIDEQRSRVVQAVLGTGLFPKEVIYQDYFDYSKSEIEEMKKMLEKEMAENPMQDPMMGGMGGGMPGEPGEEPMIGAPAEFAQPDPNTEAGGQEPNENKPPTESKKEIIKNIYDKILLEDEDTSKRRALQRIMEKIS